MDIASNTIVSDLLRSLTRLLELCTSAYTTGITAQLDTDNTYLDVLEELNIKYGTDMREETRQFLTIICNIVDIITANMGE